MVNSVKLSGSLRDGSKREGVDTFQLKIKFERSGFCESNRPHMTHPYIFGIVRLLSISYQHTTVNNADIASQTILGSRSKTTVFRLAVFALLLFYLISTPQPRNQFDLCTLSTENSPPIHRQPPAFQPSVLILFF